jgi:hypothetical protein
MEKQKGYLEKRKKQTSSTPASQRGGEAKATTAR